MTTEILDAHVRLGRQLIRMGEKSLDDLLHDWDLDRSAYWDALAGKTHAHVDAAPLLPSEALAADLRNAIFAIGDEPQAIHPVKEGDTLLCGVPGCGRPHRARGYCMAHFKRVNRDGDAQVDTPLAEPRQPNGKMCRTEGCTKSVLTRRNATALPEAEEYCPKCYRNLRDRQRRAEKTRREVVFA